MLKINLVDATKMALPISFMFAADEIMGTKDGGKMIDDIYIVVNVKGNKLMSQKEREAFLKSLLIKKGIRVI